MAVQIVMDRTGDSRHQFDPGDAQEVAKAERRFRQLTNAGLLLGTSAGPRHRVQTRTRLAWRVNRPTASRFLFNRGGQ